MNDEFGAQEQLSRLREDWIAQEGDGMPEGEVVQGWYVPMNINTLACELRYHGEKFMDELVDVSSNAGFLNYKLYQFLKKPLYDRATRERVEAGRITRMRSIFDELYSKYQYVLSTKKQIEKITNNNSPFALYLRDFIYKPVSTNNGSVGFFGPDKFKERDFRRDYASKLLPVPLLWVANPSEMSGIDGASVDMTDDYYNGYCVYTGDDWQNEIKVLIEGASAIIVNNDTMSPGVISEIEMIIQLNRIEDSYFTSPEQVIERFNVEKVNKLTAHISELKMHDKPVKQLSSLSISSFWLENQGRDNGENYLKEYQLDLNSLREFTDNINPDINLALLNCLLSAYLLLEDPDGIISVLDMMVFVASSLDDASLSSKLEVARTYSYFADRLFEAIKYQYFETSVDRCVSAFTSDYSESDIECNDEGSETDSGFESVTQAIRIKIEEIKKVDDISERIDFLQSLLEGNGLSNIDCSLVYAMLGNCYFEQFYYSVKNANKPKETSRYFEESVNNYNQAIFFAPSVASNYWNRGYVYEMASHLRYALDNYNDAIKCNPVYLDAYIYRARVLEGLGKIWLANDTHLKILSISPENKKLNKKYKQFKRRWRISA